MHANSKYVYSKSKCTCHIQVDVLYVDVQWIFMTKWPGVYLTETDVSSFEMPQGLIQWETQDTSL